MKHFGLYVLWIISASFLSATENELWSNGRITPEQPFPAKVIGSISSWGGAEHYWAPDNIDYFFSGRAKMKVIECLQGGLKVGDELEVTWKRIQRRVSCPPMIPFKGKCGWIFGSKVDRNSEVPLGHAFVSLKQGKEAKRKYELKSERELYRYKKMVTTGLQERVFDSSGKEATISFSPDSDPQARLLLSKLLELEGVNGTVSETKWKGVPFNQAIMLRGELKPKMLKTKLAPNLPVAELYQEFVLKEVQVQFPFSRHRAGKVFDTGFIETHFSFDTLFPAGFELEGKKVDFSKFTKHKK